MLDAALDYAVRGWPVLPLHHPVGDACSCGRADCASPGKHPRTPNGLKAATTDSGTITSWWQRWPDANIGLRTGVAFDVLDVDGPEGLDSLAKVAPFGDDTELTLPAVDTGKGWHFYCRPTGHGNRGGLLEHVDWRGADGYVVAPPSRHISGATYTWFERPSSPDQCPPWLLGLLERPAAPRPHSEVPLASSSSPYGRPALESEVGRVALAPEGRRNDTLNRAAFSLAQLVAGGQLDQDEVIDALLTAGLHAGLGAHEAEATIASGMRTGMQQPRRPKGVAS
jgi:hypothetical protein